MAPLSCTYPGCSRPLDSHKLCCQHAAMHRAGKPLRPISPRRTSSPDQFVRVVGDVAYIDLLNAIGEVVGVAVADADDARLLGTRFWHLSQGYASGRARIGRRKLCSMHRFLLGMSGHAIVDHKNGDTLDNRRCNLRTVTQAENGQNRQKLVVNNTSGYRGVSYDSARGKWAAYAKIGGKKRTAGRYDTPEEAAEAARLLRLSLGMLSDGR